MSLKGLGGCVLFAFEGCSMKRSHGLLAVSGLAVTMVFAGCSDDPAPQSAGPAGSAGSATGGTAAGTSTAAGTTSAGTFGTAGTDVGGSSTAGNGGATGGTATGGTTATAGTATGGTSGGTGGAPHVIVPTVFLIDNLRLAPKPDAAGGAGGADGAGTAGAAADTGGAADAGGAGGAGGAADAGLPDFFLTFDADPGPFKIHSDGFSPQVGGDTVGTPPIFDQTTLLWEAATGNPGGTAKVSIPFSVPNQQADFGGTFAVPADLTHYELTADVKMTATGDAGSCATVFLYVYGGNGYANDFTAEPSKGVTRHIVKGEWSKVRLDLDGPYGFHSTNNHPNFKPTAVAVWGAQFNTFGCP
jgi:hypothetical protein